NLSKLHTLRLGFNLHESKHFAIEHLLARKAKLHRLILFGYHDKINCFELVLCAWLMLRANNQLDRKLEFDSLDFKCTISANMDINLACDQLGTYSTQKRIVELIMNGADAARKQ